MSIQWTTGNELHTYCTCHACLKGGTVDYLTNVIMHALILEGGLTHNEILAKLICFGADGVSTIQGPKSSVTTQIWDK